MLLLHGDEDRFPYRQSLAMHNRLQDYGVHSEIEIYRVNVMLGFNQEPDLTITANRVSEFIAKQFGLTASIPGKSLRAEKLTHVTSFDVVNGLKKGGIFCGWK